MSTNKDSHDDDRDKELQNKDRDQELQNKDRDQEQQRKDRSTEQIDPEHPERLKDGNHRMNERLNEVQGEVSYNQTNPRELEHPNSDNESLWKDIESDYRRRYPNVTDEDVNYKSGEFDAMTERIAKRTNRNREDVYNEIRDWKKSTQNE